MRPAGINAGNELITNDGDGKRDGFHDVRCLLLSYKNVLKIDNLVGFEKLVKLQLDNNIIERIENLGHLTTLEWLDLSFNNITAISGLETLTNLTNLSLFSNRLTEVKGLDTLTKLQCLSLGNNLISDFQSVMYLRPFKMLQAANFVGNPLCQASTAGIPPTRAARRRHVPPGRMRRTRCAVPQRPAHVAARAGAATRALHSRGILRHAPAMLRVWCPHARPSRFFPSAPATDNPVGIAPQSTIGSVACTCPTAARSRRPGRPARLPARAPHSAPLRHDARSLPPPQPQETEYRPYVLAFLKHLKYLDYRLVDEQAVQSAREQYQDELQDMQETEAHDEAAEQAAAVRAARSAQLAAANAGNAELLLRELLWEGDGDLAKLRSHPVMAACTSELASALNELMDECVTSSLQMHQLKAEEKRLFTSALDEAKARGAPISSARGGSRLWRMR